MDVDWKRQLTTLVHASFTHSRPATSGCRGTLKASSPTQPLPLPGGASEQHPATALSLRPAAVTSCPQRKPREAARFSAAPRRSWRRSCPKGQSSFDMVGFETITHWTNFRILNFSLFSLLELRLDIRFCGIASFQPPSSFLG